MAKPRKTIVVALMSALALVAPLILLTPAAAGNVDIHLWGSTAGGWGSTNTSLTIPGPTLIVTVGDNVTLYLNGTDGANHNWFIDYDNDTNVDAGEPSSPTFRDVEVKWNFTADRNGTFIYRSRFNPDTANMHGTIIVRAAGAAPADNTIVIAVGGVVIVFAVLVVASMMWRRMKGTPPPPPKS